MVRTVKSHNEEEEEEDEDEHVFASHDSSQKVKTEGRSGDRKANASRSKHSETEQRRRSKINERFQILRDLIPENDQKRDKASFLLEVIQYVQFLQEKVQIYEGTYQGWSPEPSKLIPWRSNSGPVESFVEQSPVISNGCSQEDNIAVTPTLLANAQHSVESNLSGTAVYKLTDHPNGSADQVIPLHMPLQPNLFEGMSSQPPQGSIPDVEHLASQSQSLYLPGKWSTDCAITNFTPNEQEDLRSETGEANVSNAYSQRLLNNLTRVLQSSGVDLSQASISVQLDIGKRRNTGSTTATYGTKDNQNQPGVQPMAQYATSADNHDHGNKRLRTQGS